RGDAEEHADEIALRHGSENVDVALHQSVLRDDNDRMGTLVQQLEYAPAELPLPFYGLIAICGGAQCDDVRPIPGPAQFAAQGLDGIRLGNQAGFEIESGRITKIRVRRACVAICATVLAPAVRVDCAIEGN